MLHDDDHWIEFNGVQGGRPVRPLCLAAMAAAGPGSSRTAIDLGCGAGVETKALLDAGWRVHAVDGSPDTAAVVARTVGGFHRRLTVDVRHYTDLVDLPPADLVYAGYSLPYQDRTSFDRVWELVRKALRPGAVLAVNLFGENDSWAGTPGQTYLSEADVRALLDGLEVRSFVEEDADGPAYSGPKHWHVFDVLAVNGS
ncbi:class I SAM-dependent methyltransferase [Actinoplanes sp. NPDC049548]|uniref:class I SAM-dependent DNA methyltransferase n=1 Tax=Actinoplanes sp. NPDC049548 TaxID=3155152 RepID=UPI00341935A6